MLGPFSDLDSGFAEDIRQAAFALDEIGDHTGIIKYIDNNKQYWWSILQLHDKIPAAKTSFDQVKKDLDQTLRQRLINQRMGILQESIQSLSNHTVYYPSLR